LESSAVILNDQISQGNVATW